MADSHDHKHDVAAVHTSEEGFDHTEPRSGWIAATGVASIIALVGIILAIQYYFDRFAEQQLYQQVLEPVADDLTNLRDREDTELHQDKYVDRKAGTVRISIERAMDLLAKEYAEGRLPYPTAPAAIKPITPEGGVPAPAAGPGQPAVPGQPVAAPPTAAAPKAAAPKAAN